MYMKYVIVCYSLKEKRVLQTYPVFDNFIHAFKWMEADAKEFYKEEIEDAESDEEKEKINLIIEVDGAAYPPVGHIYLPSVDGYGWTWDILTYNE